MADNVTSIRDPRISLKATDKLKSFYKEFKEDLLKYKEPIPENLLRLDADSDVLLKATDVEWLNSYLKDKRRSEAGDFEALATGPSLDVEIRKLLENEENVRNAGAPRSRSQPYLHDLVDFSTFSLPRNEVVERNPILAARIEKLKKDQAEKDYKAMIRNVDTTKKFMRDDTIAYQINMMNRHLVAVGQFVVSVGAGFAFGFLGVQLAIGDLEFGFRLLLGIACALIIAVAEFYFLAKHLNDEEVHRATDNRNFHLNTSTSKSHKD